MEAAGAEAASRWEGDPIRYARSKRSGFAGVRRWFGGGVVHKQLRSLHEAVLLWGKQSSRNSGWDQRQCKGVVGVADDSDFPGSAERRIHLKQCLRFVPTPHLYGAQRDRRCPSEFL